MAEASPPPQDGAPVADQAVAHARATMLSLLEANERLVMAKLHADGVAAEALHDMAEQVGKSQRDPVTDTPGRALLLNRLESAIARARRHGDGLAVLYIHLDRHDGSAPHAQPDSEDRVMQLAARRLQSNVRSTDTVSRQRGEAFLVMLSDLAHPTDAGLIAEKLLSALSVPDTVAGGAADGLAASVGIAIYPDDAEDPLALVEHADEASRANEGETGKVAFHTVAADEPARLIRLDALREANEQLVIAAMNAQELEDRASESHRRQISFLAMVAHELRNPLAPLRSAATLLRRTQGDQAMFDRLHESIERQVSHLSRLVDDLLDGARVSANKFRLECNPIDLVQILQMAIDNCATAVQAKGQVLQTHLPKEPLMLMGDALRLGQVFTNLLDNASKYTPTGGVIRTRAVREGDQVVVRVQDNGVGIDAAMLGRVFDLFVQDPRALVHGNGGLGIGLAVVRDLVEAHGGSVTAYSDGPGTGSSFIVTLPLGIGSGTPAARSLAMRDDATQP